MKIAFSVGPNGAGLDAEVDPRFGRARRFLIVDADEERVVKEMDNSRALNMAHGAGITSAAAVIDEGVDAVASGFVGPKAFSVLKAAGIRVYSGLSGTVKEALQGIKAGGLQPDQGPSSNGHP